MLDCVCGVIGRLVRVSFARTTTTRVFAMWYVSNDRSHSQALGKPGYYIFNFAVLLTMYGAAIGTMVCLFPLNHPQIVMTDFLTGLPIMTNNPELKRYIMQGILTVLAIILCLLKDPSLLVTISSFGLFALVISFILLFVYGVTNFSFSFKREYLFPLSASAFFNKIGIYIYSLGFTLFLLSQLVALAPRTHA